MSILNNILQKKEVENYFLTLGVEEHHVFAAATKISGKKITILGTGESVFTEKNNEIEAVDIAISSAEKSLGKKVLIDKVIFGLPIAFLKEEKIKPEILERLKMISKELSLKPSGFIEYPQAIAYYLQVKEEAPTTVILLSAGTCYLTFTLLRVGKIEFTMTIERSANILNDFEKILGSFSSEVLPSKILIFDENRNSALEQLKEELLTFRWQKHPAFLHTPKIEILPRSFIINALVEAAAGSFLKEWIIEEKSEKIETENEIKKETVEPLEETFGFTGEEPPTEKKEVSYETDETIHRGGDEKDDTDKQSLIARIKRKIPSLPIPLFSFPKPSFNMSIFPSVALIIVIVFVLGLVKFLYWSYPKATIKLIVYPVIKSAQADFTFTTDPTRLNSGKNLVLANTIAEEVNGEKTGTVSGKTKIGDAARGEVTIYNKATALSILPKNSLLETGGIKYQLEEEVKIASASDTGEGLTFGKAVGKIRAANIGPEGNLAAGNSFTFKDFPQTVVYAKNNDKLTGGTSREISSVSKEDQDKLLSDLTAELEISAKQKILQKLPAGIKILDGSFQKNVISKKFSGEVGSEARELTLTLSLKLVGLTFSQDDLSSLSKQVLTAPQDGYIQDQEKTQISISQMQTQKNGDIKTKINLSSYFLPDLDKKNIIDQINGKSYEKAADFLSSQKGVGGIQIIQDSTLPFYGNRLPGKGENINLQVIPR